MRAETLRADLIAGLTASMVLIPQLAYLQLAGMPALHGLYAAFLPVMVAALWGSSNQMSSGPVVVASLLTASALGGLALPGSADYEFGHRVGADGRVIQLSMATFRMGRIVSFLSHPVVVGFINAAALIIQFVADQQAPGGADRFERLVAAGCGGGVLPNSRHTSRHAPDRSFITRWYSRLKAFLAETARRHVGGRIDDDFEVGDQLRERHDVRVDRIAPPEVRELVDGIERARQRVRG